MYRELSSLIRSTSLNTTSVSSSAEKSGKEVPRGVTFKITDKEWNVNYDDHKSHEYRNLTEKIVLEVGKILKFGIMRAIN